MPVNSLLTTIALTSKNPYHATISQDGMRFYTANYSDRTISVVDTSSNTLLSELTVGTGRQARAVAVNPDRSKLYCATRNNTVDVIATSTNTVLNSISVSGSFNDIVCDSTGAKVYVCNQGGNSITVINTSTNAVEATISVGSSPRAIALYGTKGYVTNSTGNSVSVLNLSDNTVSTTISLGAGKGPIGITVNSDGSKVYTANYSDSTISVINASDNTLSTSFSVTNNPNSIAFDRSFLYLGCISDNAVRVVNTANNSVVATVSLGNASYYPQWVAVKSGSRVYVSNYYDEQGTISVIDIAAPPSGFFAMF